MRLILILVVLVFAVPVVAPMINTPLSNMIFKAKPAPWETVIGLYFPTGTSGKPIQSPEFGSLQQCLNWTAGMSAMHRGYAGGSGGAQWACGWGIFIDYKEQTGLPGFRGFTQND